MNSLHFSTQHFMHAYGFQPLVSKHLCTHRTLHCMNFLYNCYNKKNSCDKDGERHAKHSIKMDFIYSSICVFARIIQLSVKQYFVIQLYNVWYVRDQSCEENRACWYTKFDHFSKVSSAITYLFYHYNTVCLRYFHSSFKIYLAL